MVTIATLRLLLLIMATDQTCATSDPGESLIILPADVDTHGVPRSPMLIISILLPSNAVRKVPTVKR